MSYCIGSACGSAWHIVKLHRRVVGTRANALLRAMGNTENQRAEGGTSFVHLSH